MAYGNYIETYKRVWYEKLGESLVYSIDVYYKYRQDSVNGKTELITQKIRFNQHYPGWGMPTETITVGLNVGSSSSASSSDTYTLSIPPNGSGNTYSEKEINKTITLTANSDGSTNVYLYWYAYATGKDAYKPAFNTWQSSSVDIPKMELVSKLTIADTITVSGADAISASWTPYKAEHRYRLVIGFTGGAKKYLPDEKNYYKPSDAEIAAKLKTISFNLATSDVLSDGNTIGSKFKSNASIYAGAWLETYDTDGNKLFASPTVLTTLVLSDNVKPVITRASVTGSTSIGTTGVRWLTNKSQPSISISVAPPLGTTINSVKIKVQKYNGNAFADEKVVEFNNLNNSAATTTVKLQPFTTSGKRQMIINVTDSRGRTSADNTVQFGSVEAAQTFYSYHEPEVSTCSYLVDISNKKLILNFAGSFSSINNLNSVKTLKFVITNKTTGTTTEHDLSVSSWTASGDDYTASYTLELAADGASGQVGNVETDVFSYYLVFADQLYVTQTSEKTTGEAVMSFLAGGKGVSFFKKATEDRFCVHRPARFYRADNENVMVDFLPYDDYNELAIRNPNADRSLCVTLNNEGWGGLWHSKKGYGMCWDDNSIAITPWANIGSASKPVYFDSYGAPAACGDLTTKVISQMALEAKTLTFTSIAKDASIEGAATITLKSGYICMGSTGFHLSTTDDTSNVSYAKFLNLYRCQVYGNKLYYGITNMGDNARTPKLKLYLLWVKSS